MAPISSAGGADAGHVSTDAAMNARGSAGASPDAGASGVPRMREAAGDGSAAGSPARPTVMPTAGSGAAQSPGAGEVDAGRAGTHGADASVPDAGAEGPASSRIAHVFVIAMENHDEGSIIGNGRDASYINGELVQKYAYAAKFVDRLALDVPSEPHYVWMEAGTNSFGDHTFTSDDAPSASNSTASRDHLSTQLAAKGLSWMSYQEGIDGTSGACPIRGAGHYQPKHDPFIFFQDVAGNPPSKSNADCAAHHREYGKLADDLKAGNVANYNFITPDLCHDMHGDTGCPSSNTIKAGDDWLRQNLPPLIAFADAHDGVIFIVWDEGESSLQIPFLAIGARVKAHYAGSVQYDHSSLVKTVETIFDLPVLSKVSAAHDFGDLFNAGQFP